MIISYKTFNTSIEFEEWQRGNPHKKIINIQPLPVSIEGDEDQDAQQFSADIIMNIFVTFFLNEDGKEIKEAV